MELNQDKQQIAKNLYIHSERTQAEIADMLDVNRKTLYLWAKNGKWEQCRIAFRVTPDMILNNFWGYIDKVDQDIRRRAPEDQCPTMEEVNKLNKLVRTANLINTNHIGWYMQAYEEFIRYLHQTDLPLAKSVVTASDRYIKGLLGHTWETAIDLTASRHITYAKQNLEEIDKNEDPGLGEGATENETPSGPIHEEVKDEINASGPNAPSSDGSGRSGVLCGTDGAFLTPADIRPKPAIAKRLDENKDGCDGSNAPQNIFSQNDCPAENRETLTPQPSVENYQLQPEAPDAATSRSASGEGLVEATLSQQRTAGSGLQPEAPDAATSRSASGEGLVEATLPQQQTTDTREMTAAAIRKEEMGKLMNMEIYDNYRDILKRMTSDIYAKVNVKGKEVNKMWFQYNLSQMERPEEKRLLMTEAEFLRWHATEATLNYMRRNG